MSLTSILVAAMVGLATGQAAAPAQTDAADPKVARVATEAVHSTDDDDKMVCRRERKTGSNMMVNDCRTVGQRRKEAQAAQDALRRNPDPKSVN